MKLERTFHFLGIAEAVSFLLLLGVAMPLKYMAGKPEAVRIVGMLHGALFVAYVVIAFVYGERQNWSPKTMAKAFVSAVLPFGPIYFHRWIKTHTPA